MTTTRDYAAEYLAARTAYWRIGEHPGITARGYDLEVEAWRIVDDADRAGVDLYPHVIDIDETARRAVIAETEA